MGWEHLKSGDIVDVVLPASGCSRDELKNSIQYLIKKGFTPRYNKSEILRKDFIFSNTDELRAKQFIDAINNDISKAIWCVRGGYGCNRLIPYLQKMNAPKNQKILIGLSDVSVLHQFVNQKWNWKSLHASVLTRLGDGRGTDRDEKALWKLLKGEANEIIFKIKPLNKKCKQTIRSKIAGGNLCVVHMTQGSTWKPNWKNKIVFFEDVNERGYSIDRMLNSLQSSGAFNGVKAVVFGEFVGGVEPDGKNFVKKALLRFADQAPFAVFSGIPSGHGKVQMPVPFNTRSEIKKAKNGWVISSKSGANE